MTFLEMLKNCDNLNFPSNKFLRLFETFQTFLKTFEIYKNTIFLYHFLPNNNPKFLPSKNIKFFPSKKYQIFTSQKSPDFNFKKFALFPQKTPKILQIHPKFIPISPI
jgi:hypothetical protein